MIQLTNLATGYGRKVVTSGLTETLQEGQLVSLLGANGVGKSTLLRTLCAFQPPLQGEIRIQGKPLSQLTPTQQSRLIGVVLTERPDTDNLTVRDMVAMGRSPYTGFWGTLHPDDELIVSRAMQLVDISHMQNRKVSTLSDGERQKTMIAKALAQETPIILLDEPTAFLDFPSKVEMTRLLRRLAHEEKKVIFLSTHDVEMALQLSDRLWLMTTDGVISGTPQQLSQDGSLAAFIQQDGIHFDPNLMSYRISTTTSPEKGEV